jgi:hypothetical protein
LRRRFSKRREPERIKIQWPISQRSVGFPKSELFHTD